MTRKTDGMLCEICKRKPEYVRVDRFHGLAYWTIRVRCCGREECVRIKAPSINGQDGFVLSTVESWR